MTALNVAIFLLCFAIASGLQCYYCDPSKSAFCDNPVLSFVGAYRKMDCSMQSSTLGSILPQECMKIVGVDKYGRRFTARSCVSSVRSLLKINVCQIVAKTISFTHPEELQALDCYTCKTDLCNSAPKVGSAVAIFGLLAACLAFFF